MARKRAPPRGGKRISIVEAFRKLRPALGPHGAGKLMNEAILDDKRARLFCDGLVVDPSFIRTHLVVKVRVARRRSSAEIEATRMLEKPVESYNWQMDAKEIEALRSMATAVRGTDAIDDRPRRRPGSKPRDEWPLLVAARLIYIARYDPEALGNIEALIKPMQDFLQEEIGWHPKDRKQMREKIGFLLQFVRQ